MTYLGKNYFERFRQIMTKKSANSFVRAFTIIICECYIAFFLRFNRIARYCQYFLRNRAAERNGVDGCMASKAFESADEDSDFLFVIGHTADCVASGNRRALNGIMGVEFGHLFHNACV